VDVKVESGGRGRKSRVIPVRYRILCDPTLLDERQSPDVPPEAPEWPADESGFLAYAEEERDAITAALDRVGAQYQVVPEEPEVYHIVCDLEAAAPACSEQGAWSRSDVGFVAPTAAERDRIEAALTRARVPYTVNMRAPDQEFLRRLEGRVTTRSAALAAMATGTLPPLLSDITEMSARLDKAASAQATMPEEGMASASRGEKLSAALFITLATACFVPGIGHLGEGRTRTGWALLAGAWVLATIGFLLVSGLHARWRRRWLRIIFPLAVGGVILLFGILGSNPTVVPSEPSGIPRGRQGTGAAAAPSLAGTEGSANSPGVEPVEPKSKAPVQRAEEPPPPGVAPVAAGKARPLKVELRFLEADPMPPGVPGGRPLSSLELRIANPNEQPVFVNKAGVLLPGGTPVDAPPVTDSTWKTGEAIPPHQNYSLIFRDAGLLELCSVLERLEFHGKVLLVGWCEDGDGKRHESTPVEFDVEEARATATYP
jgi:hypothetical protein